MRAVIPYGVYWSTPFAKWQGSFSELHSLRFLAHTARNWVAQQEIDVSTIDFGVLGYTVPQAGSFYGLPWTMGMIGARDVAGPTISQACSTGVAAVAAAAAEIECERAAVALVLTADRVSNGPQIRYPDPNGEGVIENWVQDNFACDPLSLGSMLATAERVAADWSIDTVEQNEVTLRRYEQYSGATANDAAFLKRFMQLPFAVPDQSYSRTVGTLGGDEGIYPTSREALERLAPVIEGGTVTRGGQTHPADGNAGLLLCHADLARQFSRDSAITVDVIGFATARERVGFMPAAPVPATRRVLEKSGLRMSDISAIKSHNPFIVNDIVFAREMKADIMKMNNYGCSLVWGHPQGPTALRCLIELIEELVLKGGGYGLFQGCAAGDTAMAAIVKVH